MASFEADAEMEEDSSDWRSLRAAGLVAFRAGDLAAAESNFASAVAALCPVIDGDGDEDGAGLEEIPHYETNTLKAAAELCR